MRAAENEREVPERAVTTPAQFWQIAATSSHTPLPLDFECTVTYVDAHWGLLWGLHEGKPFFLPTSKEAPLPVQAGERVRLQGLVVASEGLSASRLGTIVIEEHPNVPTAEFTAAAPDLKAFDKQVVRLEGLVEKQQEQDGHVVWQLRVGKLLVIARHGTAHPASLPSLQNRRVRMRGVLVVASTSGELQLWVPSPESIQLLETAAPGQVAAPSPAIVAASEAEAIRSLQDLWDRAGRGNGTSWPIHLELTVNYYDPSWGLLWGENQGAPGFLKCLGDPLPIRAGQRIRIDGRVLAGDGISNRDVTITVLSEHVSSPAEPVAGAIGESNRFNQHRVVLEGVVDRQTQPDASHVLCEVIGEGHTVAARMYLREGETVPNFQGSVVRVTGVYSPKVDLSGELLGIDLWVASPKDIEVIAPLRRDPRFGIKVTPIEEIGMTRNLVRIVGDVRAYESGRKLVVRDITGHAELSILQAQPLRIGDRIEAIGYPSVSGLKRSLSQAIFRPFSATDPESIRLTGRPIQLRSAERVIELGLDQAASGQPVKLTGVVTWSHPQSDFLYLQDDTRGIRVNLDPLAGSPPTPGTAVIVSGTTAAGPFAPWVVRPKFEHRGEMLLPQPLETTALQAMTGTLEGEWVEMVGYASSVAREGPWWTITLMGPSGEFVARMPGDVQLRPVVGSVVRVRGVCEASANERRQLTGVTLWVIDPTYIRTEAASPEEPFSLPLQPIASLRQFSPFPVLNRWIHVRGVVTHHVPGEVLYLDEDGEGLEVQVRPGIRVPPGEWVDVVGLPGMEGRRAVLRQAMYRRIGQSHPPVATPLANLRGVPASVDGRLISVRGLLVSLLRQPEGLLLAVQKDGAVFNASIGAASPEAMEKAWRPGSEVRLTGICRLDFGAQGQVRGFEILLRSPADVQVLRAPPWWTLGRMLSGALVLLGCVVLGLLWALSLRRRVRQQTELIRAQVAKEASLEAHNRNIVENASDFIFTATLDGRFTAFNPAGERITGYSRTEALKMNLRDLIASEDDAAAARSSLRPEYGGRAAFQARLKTRDERYIWVEISSRFITENGSRTGLLGIVRDISERKQFEDSLEKARDDAEASARAKSAFLANMSHEIRTPMNGVIGVTNLLLDTALNGEQRDLAETIRTSAESLLSVLNDILDFSKIEAGKLEFETVPFDLADTVESAVDLLAARAAAKHLELVLDTPAELPARVIGDPGRIRQVLLNLVGNAIKFTERGEIVVSVKALDATAEDVRLQFEVRDTGIGLSAADAARLFQPFTQADVSTTRKFGGTGLGLAISRQIAELMGGALAVRSSKGEGSTFTLTARFPRAPASAETAGEPLTGKRALIVDDNTTAAATLARYLASTGCSCQRASGLEEARAALQVDTGNHPPVDLVLVDAGLVPPDELSSIGALTETAQGHLPLVLLVPLDLHHTPQQLAPVRSAKVVTKPVHREELIETVRRILFPRPESARPPTAAARAPQAAPETKHRALVAEDNSVNQLVARAVLERMGFRVDLAGSGIDALEALDRSSYDVVLMDCQMPEMDGYEATRRIRAGRHKGVRIIAMTAHAMNGDRERCLEAGMDDYVSKPMRVDDLRAALQRCKVLEN